MNESNDAGSVPAQTADILENLWSSVVTYGPSVLKVIAIALIGWIIALVVRAAIRRVLHAANANKHIGRFAGSDVDVEGAIASVAYILTMLVVLLAVAGAVEVDAIGGPLQALVNPVYAYVPKLIGAGVLAVVAWVVANVARTIVTRALAGTKLDDKLAEAAESKPISETLGIVLHGAILLLFLPLILGTLEMDSLLVPVQAMIGTLLGYIPNIIGAAIVGAIGWFVAIILRDIVTSLTMTIGIDKFAERLGLSSETKLSRIAGLAVQVLVVVPAVVAALQVLAIDVITEPATALLQTMVAAVPHLVAATLIILVAVLVGRLVAPFVTRLLASLGADKLPAALGADSLFGERKISELAGKLVYFAIVLFAAVEAAGRLGFVRVMDLLGDFIAFGGDVLLGCGILVIGFFLARFAHGAITRAGGEGSGFLAQLARVAILGMVLAMGLGAMGVAEQIVTLAFSLTIGGVAVAFALAFGLGGREAAGRFLARQLDKLEK